MQKLLKKRWKLISSITIGIILAGGLGWYLLGNKAAVSTQTATIQVSKGPIEVTVSGTGSISPAVTKNIVSKVSGPISLINFKNGQTVKKGSLLFKINDDNLQNEIDKAELELKQAQIDYNASVEESKQVATTPSQSGQGSSSRTSSSNKASMSVKLQLAKLNLNTLKDQLDDYKIYSPVEGIINLSSAQSSSQKSISSSSISSSSSSSTSTSGENYLQLGDQVSNNTTLATMIGNSGMNVSIPVDEVDITKVKIGQKVAITVDALPESTFNGKVKEIATEGTQSNGVATFDVTVSIDKAAGLKVGMTANVEIMVASKEDALLLPIEAVQERGGRKFVILPQDNSSSAGSTSTDAPSTRSNGAEGSDNNSSSTKGNGYARRMGNMKVVETGLYNENMIEIKSGLQEGDTVSLPNVTKTTSTNVQGGPMGGGAFPGGNNNRNSGNSNRSGGMGFGGFGR